MMKGIDRSRLTLTATNELSTLRLLLQDVSLTRAPYARLHLNGPAFTTKSAYDELAS